MVFDIYAEVQAIGSRTGQRHKAHQTTRFRPSSKCLHGEEASCQHLSNTNHTPNAENRQDVRFAEVLLQLFAMCLFVSSATVCLPSKRRCRETPSFTSRRGAFLTRNVLESSAGLSRSTMVRGTTKSRLGSMLL